MLIGNNYVFKTETPSYDVYITIVEDRLTNLPIQIFINAGHTGSDEAAWSDALARILTGLLQTDIPMPTILMYLDGITTTYKSSGPMQVAKTLRRYWDDKSQTMEMVA
jgi:hypothetical protein